jgi:hypothetical protein
MIVERKVSDFSTEKWKWNENMKMEMKFCKTEAEMELFWSKRKPKKRTTFSDRTGG